MVDSSATDAYTMIGITSLVSETGLHFPVGNDFSDEAEVESFKTFTEVLFVLTLNVSVLLGVTTVSKRCGPPTKQQVRRNFV
ncbi:hypothetical protein Aduo_015871 [Ancylostoma duodenale]